MPQGTPSLNTGPTASVETRLGQIAGKIDATNDRLVDKIDGNFKWTIGVLGSSFVVLAGMIITSYLLLADKIDAITL